MLRIFLFTLALLVAAVTGLVARRIYAERNPPQGVATFYVGGHVVRVERAMVHDPEAREGGAVSRIDLALTWPDFRAAGAAIGEAGRTFVFLALEDAAARLSAPDDIDPADRPMALYSRFLEPEALGVHDDLVARRFRQGTPYEGEDLFVATPDERAFAARCPRPQAGGAPQEMCLWQTRLNGLEVHVRFPQRLLKEWTRIVAGVRAVVPRLAARPG